MDLKKTATVRSESFSADSQAVTVEPLPGYTDEEVVASLEDAGASRIKVLAPGFISALADGLALRKLKRIAAVHLKQESQLF